METRSRHPLAGRRILIVDDHATVRGVLELALSQSGAETATADDGTSALECIERKTPDLILLDLVMPKMDGWEVLDQLARRPQTAPIPVILQTSAEDFPSFERARQVGVAAFISKPFRLNEVVETCRKVLEGARPLLGMPARLANQPSVQVREPDGPIIAMGTLLDLDDEGAQIEIASPLPLGHVVAITLPQKGGPQELSAEVRWITNLNDRYQHGLLFSHDA